MTHVKVKLLTDPTHQLAENETSAEVSCDTSVTAECVHCRPFPIVVTFIVSCLLSLSHARPSICTLLCSHP
jgi:hypothetical protein